MAKLDGPTRTTQMHVVVGNGKHIDVSNWKLEET